jgi:hypothetical protein
LWAVGDGRWEMGDGGVEGVEGGRVREGVVYILYLIIIE